MFKIHYLPWQIQSTNEYHFIICWGYINPCVKGTHKNMNSQKFQWFNRNQISNINIISLDKYRVQILLTVPSWNCRFSSDWSCWIQASDRYPSVHSWYPGLVTSELKSPHRMWGVRSPPALLTTSLMALAICRVEKVNVNSKHFSFFSVYLFIF